MSPLAELIQEWWAAGERLAGRAPELARSLAEGSWPAGALAAVAGLALLVAGARLGRFLACAGGAAVGWIAGGLVAPVAHGWVPASLSSWTGAGVLGVACLLAPTLYPLALGVVPGLLLGSRLPVGGRAWVGGLGGGLALALLLAWLRRLVFAATAAVAGAAPVSLALLALAHPVPALLPLARRPWLVAGLAATLAIAGTAYQLGAGAARRGGRGARLRKAEVAEDG